MFRKESTGNVDLLERFCSGQSPVWLSKVTISSPVGQCLRQVVFWMILAGASPVRSLPPPPAQSFSDVENLSLRAQLHFKLGVPESSQHFSSQQNQLSHETIPSTILLTADDKRSEGARPEKGLRLDRLPQITKSACWKSPLTQASCQFSSSKLTLTSDKPALRSVLLNSLHEPQKHAQSTTLPEPTKPGDPELGVVITKPSENFDPELGLPRLQERILEPRPLPSTARQPSVYVIGRVDYFRTTNVFSGVDPVNDGLIRSGLTLFYAPAIGRNTYLVTSVDGSLIRYGNLGYLNYNELRFRAGVLQRLTPRTFGEIGWSNQQLFATREGLRNALRGDRFLNDNAIRFEVSRQDALSTKLALNTFYQFRVSFADPDDRSRLINSFITSLSYSWSPNFQTALDYQVAWSHFTQQPRDDVYHQLVARLTYTLTPQSQLNVFSGFSFGSSSDSRIDFNSFILGVGLVFNLPLF